MRRAAKKRTAVRSAASSSNRLKSRPAAKSDDQVAFRSDTKRSAAIEMLRSNGGATIDALTKATGWQPHSVRGFLAGIVRKRLKFDLQSAVVEGVRVYRITGEHGAAPVQTKLGAHRS